MQKNFRMIERTDRTNSCCMYSSNSDRLVVSGAASHTIKSAFSPSNFSIILSLVTV